MSDMPNGATLKQMIDEHDQREKELQKIIYVEGDTITINAAYEYHIPVGRCCTHEKILSWVLHLSEKEWMDLELMERFVNVALSVNNMDYPEA